VTSGTTVLTGADVVTGLKAGDTINISALGTFTAATTAYLTSVISAAGTNGDIALVKGSYNATTGIWTSSSTGTDTLVQWDSNGATAAGNVESVVLVGITSAATKAVAVIITL